MLSEIMNDAVEKIREHLSDPALKATYSRSVRLKCLEAVQAIEKYRSQIDTPSGASDSEDELGVSEEQPLRPSYWRDTTDENLILVVEAPDPDGKSSCYLDGFLGNEEFVFVKNPASKGVSFVLLKDNPQTVGMFDNGYQLASFQR